MPIWPVHERLYTAQQVKQLDQLTIQAGTTGFDLMKQAGRVAFRHLLRHWPDCRSITVFCGGGNNGGDGYVIAGLARLQNISVQLITLVDPETLIGEAQEAYIWALERRVRVEFWQDNATIRGEVVVDALLGTGLTGDVRGKYQEAITFINQNGRPVLAVDIPSGLCADRGVILGQAVKADVTVTFIGKKVGLLTGQGPELCGERRFEPLSVPEVVRRQVAPAASMINSEVINRYLVPRSRTAHKGNCGRVLLVGGDYGYAGAIILASQMAARAGAGLIKVMTRPEHVMPLLTRQPELMAEGITSVHQLDIWLDWCDVVVLGPGLGQEGWGQQIWQKVMSSECKKVIDADALNLMALHSEYMNILPSTCRDWVLTPHPGEAARLLQCAVADIESDRASAIKQLVDKYGGSVLLKGAGTLVSDGRQLGVNNSGNPGMASGGMGDVLSGLIAALRAQGVSGYDAACLGVQVHGQAADQLACHYGERGLLASDLIDVVRVLLNPECQSNASL